MDLGPDRGSQSHAPGLRPRIDDEPLRFYVGSPSFPIQREFYDVTYEAGVKVHF